LYGPLTKQPRSVCRAAQGPRTLTPVPPCHRLQGGGIGSQKDPDAGDSDDAAGGRTGPGLIVGDIARVIPNRPHARVASTGARTCDIRRGSWRGDEARSESGYPAVVLGVSGRSGGTLRTRFNPTHRPADTCTSRVRIGGPGSSRWRVRRGLTEPHRGSDRVAAQLADDGPPRWRMEH
jgi:hypothetical protein